jgi:hypothetical protein
MPELTEVPVTPNLTFVKKSEVDEKAEAIREERKLPNKPGDHVAFVELRRWLEIMDDSQLRRLNIYVYRQDPIINMQLVDPESDNNIDIFYDISKESVKDISEEYFINTHGGGRYKLVVKDLDKPKTQKGGFFEANLYVSMTQYPPKIKDLRVVDWDNPRNKGFRTWCKAQKLIDDNGMPTIDKVTPINQPQADTTVPVVKMFMDFFSKMDDKKQEQIKRDIAGQDGIGKNIADILVERMKQDDPNKQVAVMTAMITAMKGMIPEPVKQTTSELTTIMPLITAMMESGRQQTTILVESMKSQTSMLMEMLKSNAASKEGGGEGVDDTTRLKNLLEIAKMMKGGTATPEKTMTESLIEAATTILPQALGIVNNIMSLKAAQAGMGGNIVPVPAPPMQPQVVQQQPTNGVAPVQQTGAVQPMTLNEKQNAIRQFAPLFLANLGKEGWEFATWISDGFPNGDAIVASIIKDGSTDLVATIKSVPELWNQINSIYGEAHLVKWVESFCNYKEEIRKMQEEDVEGEIENAN